MVKNNTLYTFLLTFSLLLFGVTQTLRSQTFYSSTKDMFLLYLSKEHNYLIPHMQRCFENSLQFHEALFNYTPSENVTVFLHDFNDFGSGGASPLPWNFLNIGIEPYDYVYETGPTNERMNWVMNHELAHLVTTEKSTSSDRFFRSLFLGKVVATADNPLSMLYSYLTVPRWYCPRWYHEGFATFMETWMAGGIGRVLGGYDEMVFRAMVNDSSYFYDFIGLESEGKTIDFQVGANSYLYGTRFLSYLALQYGPEKLLQWVNRTEDSKAYYASQFESVYGVSLDAEWSQWITWEHRWQQENLDSIRSHPITPFRPVINYPLGSVSRSHYDPTSRTLYTAMNLPGQLAKIIAVNIDNGRIQSLCDVHTPALYYVTSLAYDRSGQRLFFTTHNSRFWRGLNMIDLKTGQSRELMNDDRIGDLVYNPNDTCIWGVQHNNGYSSVVRIVPPYNGWQVIFTLKYGKDLFDIDISPDGKYLSGSLVEISGRQTLVEIPIDSLLKGVVTYETLLEFENDTSPYNFSYSQDGKYLYGSTYYTGVSNIVRFNRSRRQKEWISNCETGFFRPVSMGNDSVLVYRYTGKGFLPVIIADKPLDDVSPVRYLGREIVDKRPIVTTWAVKSPLTINLDTLNVSSGEYNGLNHLRFISAYPIMEGYKDHISVGMRTDFTDPAFDHTVDASISYSPNRNLPEDERFHGTFNYQYSHWKLNARYNGADFYDLFGPTKSSRKGYSLALKYNTFLIYDPPRRFELVGGIAGYGGLEQLPDFQNVAASYDRFLTTSAMLNYTYQLRSLGSVDAEEGIKTRLAAGTTHVQQDVFPKVYGTLEYGVLLPIDHTSIWFRAAGGTSWGDRTQSFANYYFGGFGNNWVDYQDFKRFREYYSFPGKELNEIGGANFVRGQFELTLPPVRFRRFGFPNLYCNWAHVSLFGTCIMTNIDTPEDQVRAIDAGIQVNFKLIFFSNLESTLSFGYAAAWERAQRLSDEYMISLKIL